MQVENNLPRQNYEPTSSSFSTYCTSCKHLALTIFSQMHQIFSQTVKNLKSYLWNWFNKQTVTSQIIHSEGQASFLGGDKNDVASFVFSHLSTKESQNLLMTHKAHLKLLSQPKVLDQLFSKATVHPLKLASSVGSCTQSVTELNLSSLNWKDKGFITLIQKFPHLTTLDLSRCEQLTDQAICTLAPHLANLVSLDLSRCPNMTDTAIQAIAQHCPKLERLNLSWGPRLTDTAMQALAQGCPNLTSLDLRTEFTELNSLTDTTILALTQHCPKLSELKLWGSSVTDIAVLALAKHFPHLKSLNLGWCPNIRHPSIRYPNITGASILELARRCPDLTSLNLSGNNITDQIIQTIAQNCQNLTSLSLTSCMAITDQAIQDVAQNYPHLTHLSLVGCTYLTIDALQALSQHCPHLKELYLNGSGIQEADIQAFAGNWPQLEILDLGESYYTSEVTIQQLAQRYPKLRELHLSGTKIKDSTIWLIAKNYSHLKVLKLQSCRNVTDSAIQMLAQRCPQLTRLDLKECNQITDNAIQALAQHSPQLTHLNINSCLHIINAATLLKLAQSHPRLKIRDYGLVHDWYSAAEWYHADRPHPRGWEGAILKLISRIVSYYRLHSGIFG